MGKPHKPYKDPVAHSGLLVRIGKQEKVVTRNRECLSWQLRSEFAALLNFQLG